MAIYNLLKEANVYLHYNSNMYKLDVTSEISFSQTFTDKTYAQKTLHDRHKLHKQSNIKKANKAAFEFTCNLLKEIELDIIYDLLIDFKSATEATLKTFDLYIATADTIYKLRNSVFTNGTFIIEKLENLKLTLAGDASELSIVNSLPESSAIAPATRQYVQNKSLSVSVNGANLANILSLSIELQNTVKWNPYETVQGALNVTSASTTQFPSNFILQERKLSGSIRQYVTDSSKSSLQTWEMEVPVVIKAGDTGGFVSFSSLACTFTNRVQPGEVFTQNYDWKMNENPTDLGNVLKFLN